MATSNKNYSKIVVLGASGYIGARLVSELLKQGYSVKACGRSLQKLIKRPWKDEKNVQLAEFDVFDEQSLRNVIHDSEVAYYLLHSMDPGESDFAEADKRAAENMLRAAEESGIKRIVYLGGLGEKDQTLSKHLQSRIEVGEILQSGKIPTTVLRAAMIIGAGSASFEILRYLVERLPVMITPKWVRTEAQPIAVRNMVNYLVRCLEAESTAGNTYDIGGPDILSYQELMEIYSREAGLWKRLIIPFPVLTPRLSSYWIHLVTPVHSSIARPLAQGLSNKVVCLENRIRDEIPQELLDCKTAIKLALDQTQHNLMRDVDDHSDLTPPLEWTYPGDDDWAGGSVYEDHRVVEIKATPEEVWKPLLKIGGKNGWYYADWLWKIRGLMDNLVGGIGMRKGRTDPDNLNEGDMVDFWRIEQVRDFRRLLLKAEMKLPGSAILDFSIVTKENDTVELHQIARFIPRGLGGILYWYSVSPLHELIFTGMLSRIAQLVEKPVIRAPEKYSS
ncbi:MAG: SDR family oxidoreductase [Candidatus Dadabacteria bacterium]